MREREPLVVASLIVLVLVLWLGFLFHSSPRFAGSLWGGALGVSGGVLFLSTLVYPMVKRIPPIKRWVTARVSMRTLLAWHMYAGILGTILGLLHSGHKFNSPLGIALTAMAILVVLSGFVGRHLMKQVSMEMREKRELLTNLELAYRQTAAEVAASPEQTFFLWPFASFWPRAASRLFTSEPTSAPASLRAIRLSESIADVEYAIKSHETLKRWFAAWLTFHIVTSLVLYVLLGLHIWAGIHFGVRWFS